MMEQQATQESKENSMLFSKQLEDNIFTTAPKGKRKLNEAVRQRKNTELQSIALSMLNTKQLEERVNGLFSGEMAHLSFEILKRRYVKNLITFLSKLVPVFAKSSIN